MVDSTDLAQVLHQAHDIAQSVAQKPTTAHVLLALFTVENRAQFLLKEKGVDEDCLLERMTSQPLEQDGLIREACMRAREIAQSSGARETDCMHLLVAFTRMRCAANELMVKAGLHLINLGNTALAYCLSGSMPRRLQPGRNSMPVDMPRPSRPLGPPPSPPPASALALSPRPTPVPASSRAPSRPALSPRDLIDEVNEDALNAPKPTAEPPLPAHKERVDHASPNEQESKPKEEPQPSFEHPPLPPAGQVGNDKYRLGRAEKPRSVEHVDVLVVTSVKDEYDAVLKIDTGALSEEWVVHEGPTGLDVAFRNFQAAGGRQLRVAVTRALEMGSVAAVNAAVPLVHAYTPLCIAMPGVCAGRRGEVEQGDVIIASRLWSYDTGKITVEINNSDQRIERIEGELLTYQIPAAWQQKAESFSPPSGSHWLAERPRTYATQMDWMLERILEGVDPSRHPERKTKCPNYTKILELLWAKEWLQQKTLELTAEGSAHIKLQQLRHPDGLPEPPPFRVHVGSIGTGSRVMRDPGIFDRLAERERKLLGLEMEASAIGAMAHLHRVRYTLVMKGVMDFADSEKDDHFKPFAARASAECLLAFLRANLPHRKH
ncbi:5'-methylthioadenosine/S-adenosylhomocysteine nucleosidase family protein [Archangium violaceum]|uniref:5'-methylthioadenosine/S-adenosylhomocysteine nucleosidase family protein n=1 Tax=Archangium violaceum TaxID=83451 RepID=UPI0036DA2DFE